MDMNQYLGMFIEETKDHIQSLNDNLLKLEDTPNDNAIVNEVFRSAHTIKGMAGSMGFTKIQRLTHAMENVLSAVREGKLSINSDIMDVLFKCIDAIDTYLTAIIATGSEGSEENTELISNLEDILNVERNVQAFSQNETTDEFDEYVSKVIDRAYSQGYNVYKIKVILDSGCLLKAARAYLVFRTLEEYGEIIKSVPPVQDIEDEKFDYDFTLIVISRENINTIKNKILRISEIREVEINYIDRSKKESQRENIYESEAKKEVEVEKTKEIEKVASQHKTSKTVRVDIERLDVLMNLVSELIIIKSRIEGFTKQYNNRQYEESIEYLERITNSLHEAVMKVRMVPIERVFSRFPRMMRDLSRELNKEFELIVSGEDTEVDRTIVDELGDPLIHLLRNSADHGIETPEERVAAGKPKIGMIRISAFHDGNNVVIEVEDDGKGIDLDKVRRKAIEKGLIKEGQIDLTDQDIIDLLFLPSFSTKEVVTNLSGRGVGLDVVKTKIEQLGGVVDVVTQKGKGTKFSIRLPLTLAIIQALLIGVENEVYAIPLASIKEIVEIKKEDIVHVQGKKEVFMLRNQVIPIKKLSTILELDDKEKEKYTVVILKRGERLNGLIVDKLFGQQDIVIKSLGKYMENVKIVSGATILGDGSVVMILDPNYFNA